jgi:hypothetical protein
MQFSLCTKPTAFYCLISIAEVKKTNKVTKKRLKVNRPARKEILPFPDRPGIVIYSAHVILHGAGRHAYQP